MIKLAQYPEGCAGCGGSCCKETLPTSGLWSPKELKSLPPEIVKEEEEFKEKHKGIKTLEPCLHLTEDGLCGLQVRGLQKPEGCASFRVGNKGCMSTRIRYGIK